MIKLPGLRRIFACCFRCKVEHIIELCNRSDNEKYRQKKVTAISVQARLVV